uniref:Uncharacterized protein n=1 Tax=Romanomermis culicivorax TaxID=13658 RepID=A0A915JKV8_ROMCU
MRPTNAQTTTDMAALEVVMKDILLDKKWLTSLECDRCLNEFQHIIKTPAIVSLTFDDKSDRLDKFWLNGDVVRTSLIKVLIIVLSLSHRNYSVESGFSVNDDMLVQNLQEASLINQRMVYDSIKHHGDPSNIDVTKELLKSVKASSSRYKSALDEKIQQKVNDDAAAAGKKKLLVEIPE